MRIRKTLLAILALLTATAIHAQDMPPLPPAEQLKAINDSIISEGTRLYHLERLSWVSTDKCLEHHPIEQIGGYAIYAPSDSVLSAFYADHDGNCIFEFRLNMSNGNELIINKKRLLTPTELAVLQEKTMMTDMVKLYADSIRYLSSEIGSFNYDVMRVNDHTLRLYILQGTSMNGIIPFGNDYSLDFDERDHSVTFRRYHRSFVPSQITEHTRSTIHSHLKNNPYITATDICNFLLYGAGKGKMMDTFIVASTAYNCMFIYSLSKNSIEAISHDEFKRRTGMK